MQEGNLFSDVLMVPTITSKLREKKLLSQRPGKSDF